MAQRVDFGGVGCGRAWVSSLPKFFLGKYFHFWKLPPLFCIKSRDNVYYHVFLLENSFHFFIWKMVENGIKYAFPGRRTYVFSVDNFSGKARERVFSPYLSTAPLIYPQHNTLIYPQAQRTSPQPTDQRHTSSLAIFPQYHTTAQHSLGRHKTPHKTRLYA